MSLAGEEEHTLPAHYVPQPLTPAPYQAEAHPLLDISLTPEKGGGILRRETAERRKGQRQVRFDVGDGGSGRPLAAPRVHSSAALRSEVRREAQQEFDPEMAVRTELLRSFTVRRGVESEAAKALNVCRVHNLYRGLVSVEPPAEQMQRLTARQRRPEHREVPHIEGPDVFAFSDPCERYTETPHLKVEGLPPLPLRPRSRPAHTVFDMFHKLGQWAS
ncbi:protein phosphatase 1 regulatory subunit 35 [Bufo gargarizans]|uniref:protein phosphatase 1 regulatory subunit 35 n=1 Tax=Bufo gargarizans TaxID=30331 RepID=UPI001CF1288A|nr:protein phosphatase 1 regulatory subunit 35 [Bufo gargarizans]XP_044130021.1 protein phosphatase 1 regulatory subunit 35 [Bufo gargarizans]